MMWNSVARVIRDVRQTLGVWPVIFVFCPLVAGGAAFLGGLSYAPDRAPEAFTRPRAG